MKRIRLFLIAIASFYVINGTYAQETNSLFIKKTVTGEFNVVVEKVTLKLKEIGFGVITDIDMDQKLEEKLDVDLKPYKILGVCNPSFAYKALQAEPNVGVFLPCKVVLKELEGNQVEVVSSNPSILMKVLNNDELNKLADEVTIKIKMAIENL